MVSEMMGMLSDHGLRIGKLLVRSTTIDEKNLTGDESCPVRGKERDDIRDILRLSESPEGNPIDELLDFGRWVAPGLLGVGAKAV